MANKDAAFGLRPIGKVGQNRDNQGLSEYSIAASATAMFFQDPIKQTSDGTIGVAAAGDTLLGSLNGVFFTDATTSKPTFANHLKGSNTATDIIGFVADDPYERFEVQSNNSSSSDQTDVFLNADIVYAAGDSANFVSAVELNDSTLTTSSAQLQVIGVSKDPDNNELGSANVNFVAVINEHAYRSTTGV
jgi:hypothetical protein